MAFAKRIILFLAVNFLVVLTISLVLNILNVRPYLQHYGLDYYSLALFCLIWGIGGALISLSLSRIMAKWLMSIELVDAHTKNPQFAKLVSMVSALSQAAHLKAVPEIGVYNSADINAFATGPTQRRSLVAVSSGLLNRMSDSELKAVLAHEISHIANGDMVTMTLIQGIVNAFVMFLARILAFALSGLQKNKNEGRASSHGSFMMMTFVFEILFMILGSMVIGWFSRQREFRADAGGARLAGKNAMIGALRALQRVQEKVLREAEPKAALAASFEALKISAPKGKSWLRFFATHPPLEDRIAQLEMLSCN